MVVEEVGQGWTAVLLFVLGACVGSFLNVCITRLPHGESILRPRSRCRACNTRLPARAMVPLVSYVVLRGRCGRCGGRIPARYSLVELCAAALAPACHYRFGAGVLFPARLFLAYTLLAAAVTDLETGLVPDPISAAGTAAALALACIATALSTAGLPSPRGALLGALLGGGVLLATARGYRAVTGRDGLGGGDVKLLAMIGSFAGWDGIPDILFLSALTGTLWGIGLMLLRKDVALTTPLPFAPFLCLGTVLRMA